MKRIKIICFIVFLSIGIRAFSQDINTIPNVYKVVKIDTIRSAYLIQITKLDDSEMRYSIVLLKDSTNLNDLKRIIVGEKYNLDLRLYSDTYVITNVPWYDVFIGNTKIRIREEYIYGQIAFSNILDWKLIEE